MTSTGPSSEPKDHGRWRALALLSLVELLGMSLWFSAAAVIPALRLEWQLGNASTGWLTVAVQLGFVVGTLLSAVLNLPDIINARKLMALSSFAGAITNAAFAYYSHGPTLAIGLRFLTGLFLAGVYPPGMKIMATWFRRSRGMALGILVGALTLGKASPYLINSIGNPDWRQNVMFVSVLAILGGLIVLFFVDDGPYALPNAPFDWTQVVKVFRNRGVRLASFGYFGHMWELYAMWAWTPVMIRASLASNTGWGSYAELTSFLVIGCGAIGCAIGGITADRFGRTVVTSIAMMVSGLCCLVIGLQFGGPPAVLLIIAAIWGASVIADSAQFSACITELADPRYIGTALTIQTSLGFLLTSISIELVPYAVERVGWRYAFAVLAPGPLLGVLAMMRLRMLPEAVKIAHGRR